MSLRYLVLRIVRRIGLAKNVNWISGLQLTSGECRIGVEREIADRERADGVKGKDCDTFHRVRAPASKDD
jgi:hypothetical protein